jgi:hypothetical protein
VPIVLPPSPGPANGAPSFALSGNYAIVKFGNQSLPNGQGILSWINLNDRKSWFCQAPLIPYANRQFTLGQLVYRGRSTMLARDWNNWKFAIPFMYEEGTSFGGSGAVLGQALAPIMMAGPQYITFDNTTGLICEFSGCLNRKMMVPASPYLWSFELELQALSSFFTDLSTTSIGSQTLSSGSATTFNVTYPGSVWCEPTWTLTITAANAAAIQSFSLSNTMSGETLLINFPGNLAASLAWTITINSSTFQVSDQTGLLYDCSGSFPNLYPPAGQVNTMSATITPVSGTVTHASLAGLYTSRWVI